MVSSADNRIYILAYPNPLEDFSAIDRPMES